jgi:hypothetical protein
VNFFELSRVFSTSDLELTAWLFNAMGDSGRQVRIKELLERYTIDDLHTCEYFCPHGNYD